MVLLSKPVYSPDKSSSSDSMINDQIEEQRAAEMLMTFYSNGADTCLKRFFLSFLLQILKSRPGPIQW